MGPVRADSDPTVAVRPLTPDDSNRLRYWYWEQVTGAFYSYNMTGSDRIYSDLIPCSVFYNLNIKIVNKKNEPQHVWHGGTSRGRKCEWSQN